MRFEVKRSTLPGRRFRAHERSAKVPPHFLQALAYAAPLGAAPMDVACDTELV